MYLLTHLLTYLYVKVNDVHISSGILSMNNHTKNYVSNQTFTLSPFAETTFENIVTNEGIARHIVFCHTDFSFFLSVYFYLKNYEKIVMYFLMHFYYFHLSL